MYHTVYLIIIRYNTYLYIFIISRTNFFYIISILFLYCFYQHCFYIILSILLFTSFQQYYFLLILFLLIYFYFFLKILYFLPFFQIKPLNSCRPIVTTTGGTISKAEYLIINIHRAAQVRQLVRFINVNQVALQTAYL